MGFTIVVFFLWLFWFTIWGLWSIDGRSPSLDTQLPCLFDQYNLWSCESGKRLACEGAAGDGSSYLFTYAWGTFWMDWFTSPMGFSLIMDWFILLMIIVITVLHIFCTSHVCTLLYTWLCCSICCLFMRCFAPNNEFLHAAYVVSFSTPALWPSPVVCKQSLTLSCSTPAVSDPLL